MKKIITVCGPGRSGTTMLDLMLGNDSRAFSLGEVYALFRPWRTHHRNIKCSCGMNPCPKWKDIKNYNENDFHDRTFDTLGVDFLIDSSKELSWVWDVNHYAKKKDIEVINLLLFKDPVSLAYSHWKRSQSIDKGILSYIKYYQNFFDTDMSFAPVSFKRLCKSPSKYLKEICDIVGMEYFEGKEEFWTSTHHHLFGSYGTRKQSENRNSEIKSSDAYPDDFIKIIPDLEKEMSKNVALQKVMEKLVNELSICSYEYTRAIKPAWYYKRKFSSFYRRCFPQKWHLEQ